MGSFKLVQIKRCRRYSVASFFYVLAFTLFGANNNVFAQSNEGKETIYRITDPRNPDCPCHKHQKRAEREYGRLMKKSENMNVKSGDFILFNKTRRLSMSTWFNWRVKTSVKIKKQKSVKRKGLLFRKSIDACPF